MHVSDIKSFKNISAMHVSDIKSFKNISAPYGANAKQSEIISAPYGANENRVPFEISVAIIWSVSQNLLPLQPEK